MWTPGLWQLGIVMQKDDHTSVRVVLVPMRSKKSQNDSSSDRAEAVFKLSLSNMEPEKRALCRRLLP